MASKLYAERMLEQIGTSNAIRGPELECAALNVLGGVGVAVGFGAST